MVRKSQFRAARRPSRGGGARAGAPAAPATEIDPGLERALRARSSQRYVLRLYVTGVTRASAHAIERVRAICEEHLHGRYELEVIDIYQMPTLAKDHQIIATPTLIKVLPAPLRRFIGDLSEVGKILFGLDLRETG